MKKLLSIILAALIMVTAAGCGGDEKITMATNAEFEPFEYVTSASNGMHGEFSGVDIAIGLEIAKEVGKELVIENMEFTSVLTALPQGKADFAAAGMTIKPERLENMDFSIPYFVAQQVMLVKADNDTILSADDLQSAKVAVVDGYTGQTVCLDDLKLPEANVVSFKRGADAVMELKADRVDAIVIDLHTANSFAAQNSDLKTVADADAFEKEEYAIAVAKGNTELLETINSVLQRLINEGQITIWFDEQMELLSQD